MGVYMWPDDVPEIIWSPWKKRFALLPTKMRGQHKVWLEFYYIRKGHNRYMTCTQRGTVFDVLKSN